MTIKSLILYMILAINVFATIDGKKPHKTLNNKKYFFYAEKVHQYIVQEAYKLLKMQYGDATNIGQHIGITALQITCRPKEQ